MTQATKNVAGDDLPTMGTAQESSENATPGEVVAALGAMQAQDYAGALWAIGMRLPDATQTDVERAIANRMIIRTWPMRGTLHFVAAADVRWLLELLGARAAAGRAGRLRQLELDGATLARSKDVIARALEGGRQRSRSAIFAGCPPTIRPSSASRSTRSPEASRSASSACRSFCSRRKSTS